MKGKKKSYNHIIFTDTYVSFCTESPQNDFSFNTLSLTLSFSNFVLNDTILEVVSVTKGNIASSQMTY